MISHIAKPDMTASFCGAHVSSDSWTIDLVARATREQISDEMCRECWRAYEEWRSAQPAAKPTRLRSGRIPYVRPSWVPRRKRRAP